ncbi:MAG: amidohydrolase family protein [Acidimicrobiia bacterium]
MMVDALMVLGENRFGPTLEVDDALRIADELELDRVVAAPARPLDYHLEPANERLAEAARQSGGRLAALGRVDPLNGDKALAEASRCLGEQGCAGLFLHPGEEAFPATRAGHVLEVAQEHRAPVIIATGYFSLSEPLQVAQLAAEFPEIPVVMTTGGQINISGLSMVDAWLALTSNANLHVMTNGEYRQDFIEQLVSDFDFERVLYASFAPVFDPTFERKRIRSARMTLEARRAVEGGNAARLFRLGGGKE